MIFKISNGESIMILAQCQRTLNTIDKEIADLEKRKAAKDKEIASLQNKINSTNKSITKSTSQALLKSKQNQIARWETSIVKKSKESADLSKKIADKKAKRSNAYIKLQKAQQDKQKKSDQQTAKTIKNYENRINEIQRQAVQQIIKPQPLYSNQENEEYDVFVSHAWEDKDDFVDEFVSELRKQGLKVWYDTDKLKWGDSMREKIDKGLSKSRYGVVVLSPNYIAEQKYWTKAELNGLFQVETVNGKTILPIWHNLTKKQVTEYSPIIADRKALSTAIMTPAEIAKELITLFNQNEAETVDNG